MITERSVLRAALKLRTTQPALSGPLKRLRGLIGDPLRMHAGNGMAATAVALGLLPPAGEVLQGAQALFGGHAAAQGFVPALAAQYFRIAASDYLDRLFLPELVARVRSQAPGVTLDLRPLTRDGDYRSHLAMEFPTLPCCQRRGEPTHASTVVRWLREQVRDVAPELVEGRA